MRTYNRITLDGTDWDVWFYDTETHADKELTQRISYAFNHGIRPIPCDGVGVWLWYCISHDSGNYKESPHGTDRKSFRKWMEERKTPTRIYVFNLAFEVSYLIPELFNAGYTYAEKAYPNSFSRVSNESLSSVYNLELCNHNNVKIQFKDRHKRFPGGSLRSLAKDFNLKIQKSNITDGEEDPNGYQKRRRIPGYQPTEQERYYCWADCKVVEELFALKIDEYNENIAKHPTITKCRKNGKLYEKKTAETDDYKEFFLASSSASYACAMMIRETFPNEWKETPEGVKYPVKRMKQFRDRYPILDEAETEFARKSYEGGLCYPTAWVRGKDLGDTIIGHADVVSQYPSQIITRNRFPSGRGQYFQGKPTTEPNRMYLYRIRYAYESVNRIPSLKRTGVVGIWDSCFNDIDEPYNAELGIPEYRYVWDFYLDTMKRCLKGFRYEIIDGYSYEAKPCIFADYFLEHFNMKNKYKKEGKAAAKRTEKFLINSPTGKFGEKPHNIAMRAILNADGVPTRQTKEIDEFDPKFQMQAKYTYVPLISAITAYAREFLLRTAYYLGFDNICYRDTDSLRFFWNKETERKSKDPAFFGSTLRHFECDERWVRCFFAKPKAYSYQRVDDGFKGIKAGGYRAPDWEELHDKLCGFDGKDYKADRQRMISTPKGKIRVDTYHVFYNKPW